MTTTPEETQDLPPAPVAEEEEMECATCHNDGLYCNVCGYDPDGSTQPAASPAPVAEELRKGPFARFKYAHHGIGPDAVVALEYKSGTQVYRMPPPGTKLYLESQPCAPTKPAVPDVDALAKYLRGIHPEEDRWPMHTQDLAGAICNWIEEQQQ